MSNGLLSPDDMMLDNVSPGPYVSAPIYGLLSGLKEGIEIPGDVLAGEYGYYGDLSPISDDPYPQTFMESIDDPAAQFTGDFLMLPALAGSTAATIAGQTDNVLMVGSGDPLGYSRNRTIYDTDPVRDTKVIYSDPDVELIPEQIINLRDIKDGLLLPFVADQTSGARRKILGINDKMFERPVLEEGGNDFMRGLAAQGEDKAIWASHPNVLRGLLNPVTGETRPVYGVMVTMSKTGKDFSTMPADTLVEMLNYADLDPKMVKKFNENMKKEISGHEAVPDFIGVDAPVEKLREYIDEAPPKVRKKFVQVMDRAKLFEGGFPDVAAARYALTADEFKSMPENMTGFNIGRIDVDRGILMDPVNPHKTYQSQIGGEYVGRLESPIPAEFLFQDRLLFDPAVVNMRNRPQGILPQNIFGSLTSSIPKSIQVMDDLFFENLERLQEGLPAIKRKK